ncbi:MAG: hypothetical protein JXA64_04385 [Candidatus Fermentibacteraceae bacterium]|nr:hypothetical protein [Candidatus Fermentibacteraceae bacterium]MBN2608331.1 hypothetical protein [Candidatus Fermentibacteraceae bacterium]
MSGAVNSLRISAGPDGVAAVSLELGEHTGNNRVNAVAFLPDGSDFCTRVSALGIDLMMIVFQLLGGLAIFLLGMKTMSESLQRSSGTKMRVILKRVTGKRFAGLMTFPRSIGVILGSNMGTTITGKLLAFNTTDLACPTVASGFGI